MACSPRAFLLLLLISQALGVLAASPCNNAPFSIISTLKACKTASHYCTSVLGGPVSYTTTLYKTKKDFASTNTITLTSTSSITSVTSTQTITQTETVSSGTSTSLVYSTSCPTDSNDTPHHKRIEARKPAPTACGLSGAEPKKISAGCNCVFESTAYATKTRTIGAPSTVTSVVTSTINTFTISTSTTTTTVLAAIETACTEQFKIQALNGLYAGSFLQSGSDTDYPHYGGDITVFTANNAQDYFFTSASVQTYYLDLSTGYIKTTTTDDQLYIQQNSGNEYYVTQGGVDQYSSPYSNPRQLICQIDGTNNQISCVPEDPSITVEPFMCWEACDQSGHCDCLLFMSPDYGSFLEPVTLAAYPVASN